MNVGLLSFDGGEGGQIRTRRVWRTESSLENREPWSWEGPWKAFFIPSLQSQTKVAPSLVLHMSMTLSNKTSF